MAQPDKDTQQQTLVIASPNPTIDDGKTSATAAPVEAAPVKADATATAAPLKTTTKSKPMRRRTRPRT